VAAWFADNAAARHDYRVLCRDDDSKVEEGAHWECKSDDVVMFPVVLSIGPRGGLLVVGAASAPATAVPSTDVRAAMEFCAANLGVLVQHVRDAGDRQGLGRRIDKLILYKRPVTM